MATKKKAKTRGKKAKKKAGRTSARKKVTRKAVRKKVGAKKRVKTKGGQKTRAKAARSTAAAPKPAGASAPPAGQRVGIVTHYFTHLSVAIVQLDAGVLRDGDTVHVKGHTSDFKQRVESMELDHVHVAEAHAGQSVGLRVNEHAREHDVVYKVA